MKRMFTMLGLLLGLAVIGSTVVLPAGGNFSAFVVVEQL